MQYDQSTFPQSTVINAVRPLLPQTPPHTRAAVDNLELLLEQLTRTRVRYTTTQSWDRFLTLPEEQQVAAVASWEAQSLFLEAAIRSGIASTDEAGLLGLALERLGLAADPALLSKVEPGDLVEISNRSAQTVYRSVRHFSLGRYSLVELTALPPAELYERVAQPGGGIQLTERLTDEQLTFTIKAKLRARAVSRLDGETYALSVFTVEPAKA